MCVIQRALDANEASLVQSLQLVGYVQSIESEIENNCYENLCYIPMYIHQYKDLAKEGDIVFWVDGSYSITDARTDVDLELKEK